MSRLLGIATTPGEVMQLPPDEAVVMVSSVAPIKAKKVRYYSDANFQRRVLREQEFNTPKGVPA